MSAAARPLGDRATALDLQSVALTSGLLGAETLARAVRVQGETGERLGSVLTRLGFVSEEALAQALASATALPLAPPTSYPPAPDPAGARASGRFLRDAKAVPLSFDEAGVDVAFVDPTDDYAVQALALAYGCAVRRHVGRASDVEAALDRLFGPPTPASVDDPGVVDAGDLERLKDLTSDAPAIRAVNRLIATAVESRASDIHLEPGDGSLQVRVRVDGVMRELEPLPNAMKAAVVSRIKVMAGLNIAERRLPQDGRLRLAVRGHDVDLRVATAPTIHGEGVVLRLLDRSNLTLDFAALGFDAHLMERMRAVLARPHGVVLVTGPTGSGKTTTLYAALAQLNAPQRKLLTIEDPIEYRLTGINQTQVSPGIGLTFATALRAFLRQDPDVMMVGEIRDLETAQVAVQAALTGHMILSTLHTNSAAAAITRLIDMGIEPFLITSTLTAVLAQRLVRRLCLQCRAPDASQAGVLEVGPLEGRSDANLAWRAVGCAVCDGAGYRGRVALLELLIVDEAVSRLILGRAEAAAIEAAAAAAGMRSLLRDGAAKVATGVTTVEEVLRVTREASA